MRSNDYVHEQDNPTIATKRHIANSSYVQARFFAFPHGGLSRVVGALGSYAPMGFTRLRWGKLSLRGRRYGLDRKCCTRVVDLSSPEVGSWWNVDDFFWERERMI